MKQEYFPLISDPEGVAVRILDTRGREWDFHYRSWTNANSQMYVLDGLKDFMFSVQWQAGDTGNSCNLFLIKARGLFVKSNWLGLKEFMISA